MARIHTTVTIKPEILQFCKKKNLIVSRMVEEAVEARMHAEKSDSLEESAYIKRLKLDLRRSIDEITVAREFIKEFAKVQGYERIADKFTETVEKLKNARENEEKEVQP